MAPEVPIWLIVFIVSLFASPFIPMVLGAIADTAWYQHRLEMRKLKYAAELKRAKELLAIEEEL